MLFECFLPLRSAGCTRYPWGVTITDAILESKGESMERVTIKKNRSIFICNASFYLDQLDMKSYCGFFSN